MFSGNAIFQSLAQMLNLCAYALPCWSISGIMFGMHRQASVLVVQGGTGTEYVET